MIRYSTIAKSGSTNPRNDTANVVELSNGELLVLWHKYEATAAPGHDLARCRIHAKTSIGCAFTSAGNAVVNYLQVEDRDWKRFTRTGIDLQAAIVPGSRILQAGSAPA